MRRRLLTLSLMCLCAGGATLAQTPPSPQTARQATLAASINYLLFKPRSYSASGAPVPLIVFLHGSGERGDDLEKVKTWGPPAIVEKNPDFPFMVVSPQLPASEWWHANLLKAMLDEVLASHNVDRSRVYLTGLSSGGYGTWDLASRYPEYFAAIAPICGGGRPTQIERLKDVPAWVFHGAKDTTVPEQQSAIMVAALRALGGDVTYTVLPEGGHADAWKYAYGEAGLFDWFLQHRKK
jgi:predicted peptidase